MEISSSLIIGTAADGDQWIGSCPSLQVASVGSTREEAQAAVREAVTFWFRSCVVRGTLREALGELGFRLGPTPLTHDVISFKGDTYWRMPDYLSREDLVRLVQSLPDPVPAVARADLAPFHYQLHEQQELHA